MNLSANTGIGASQGVASGQPLATQTTENNDVIILRDSFAQNQGVFKRSAVYLKVQPMGNLPNLQPGKGAILENFRIAAMEVTRLEVEFTTGVTVIGFPMTKTVVVQHGDRELARFENADMKMPINIADHASLNAFLAQLPVLNEFVHLVDGSLTHHQFALQNNDFTQIVQVTGASKLLAGSRFNDRLVPIAPDQTAKLPDGRVLFLRDRHEDQPYDYVQGFLINPFLKQAWINGPMAADSVVVPSTSLSGPDLEARILERIIELGHDEQQERTWSAVTQRLQNRRRSKGFSQRKLSEVSDTPMNFICSLEKYPPIIHKNIGNFIKVARALEVDPLELLG